MIERAKSPSVSIFERDLSKFSITSSATILAIVGYAEKGPINEATMINSKRQFNNVFGNAVKDAPFAALAAYKAFNQTNRVLYYRIADNATSAEGTFDVEVEGETITFGFNSKMKGSGYNSLSFNFLKRFDLRTEQSVYSFVIYNNGTELERFGNISLDANDDNFFINVVNKDHENGGSEFLEFKEVNWGPVAEVDRILPFEITETIPAEAEIIDLEITQGSTADETITVTLRDEEVPVVLANGDTAENVVTKIAAETFSGWTTSVDSAVAEVIELNITAVPSTSGDITVTIRDDAQTIAVLDTDSVDQVATKIATGTFTGWTVNAVGSVVTFTADDAEEKTGENDFAAGATGVTTDAFDTTTFGADGGTIITFTADVAEAKIGENSIDAGTTGVLSTFDITTEGKDEETDVVTFTLNDSVNMTEGIGTDGVSTDPIVQDGLYVNALSEDSQLANSDICSFHILITPDSGSAIVQDAAIDLAENQLKQDFIYIVDPPFGATDNEVVNWHNGRDGDRNILNTSYAATYWPWLKDFNPDAREYTWLPPSVFIAAKYLEIDRVYSPWLAPAGDARGRIIASDYEVSPGRKQRDLLYGDQNAINPISNFTSKGLLIYGQKTLYREDSALNRVSVRRMVIFAKKQIKEAMDSLVFEPHLPDSWRKAASKINDILEPIRQGGGLADYRVTIDAELNTPEMQQQQVMIGLVELVPVGTIEVIEINMEVNKIGTTLS